jgi:predicted GIY-YIG superfamily endonuclease
MYCKFTAGFADDVGIPDTLVCDLATKQTGKNTPMIKEVRHLRIRVQNAEKGHSNQNHKAETKIRELKKRWKTRMIERKVPKRLWDYGLVYMAEILSITARGSIKG